MILFDVDGTLCETGGAGRRALLRAAADLIGRTIDGEAVAFAGRTDRAIVRDILADAGVDDARERILDAILQRYLSHLDDELARGPSGRLYPGVSEILERLGADPEWAVGLLTGNVEGGARRKLAHFGIADAFAFGAYGSDDADRDRLVPIARRRAVERFGPAASDAPAVVVGDTPHDIRCARAGGAAAVAVATSFYNPETLIRAGPDALLPDLSRTDEVLALLRSLTEPPR